MKVILDPRQAAPVLRAVEPTVRRRLKAALTSLAQDPSGETAHLDVKRLDIDEDGATIYRLRIGAWRVAFTVERSAIVVLRVFPRSDGYGWLKDMA